VSDRFPFLYRVALLLVLTAIGAIADWRRKGAESSRYLEYAFVWIAGLVGGTVGFLNDCVTSSISPDYFILGKGLEPGSDLRWRAGAYGFEAGLSAGIIGGAVCLFTRPKKAAMTRQAFAGLVKKLWMPVLGAVVVGSLAPLVARGFDPLNFAAQLSILLKPEQIELFRRVWWIHTGLYAGMMIGLTAMIFASRRAY
jgi:hypothetical protein